MRLVSSAGKVNIYDRGGKTRNQWKVRKVKRSLTPGQAGVFIWSKIGGEMFPTSSAGI